MKRRSNHKLLLKTLMLGLLVAVAGCGKDNNVNSSALPTPQPGQPGGQPVPTSTGNFSVHTPAVMQAKQMYNCQSGTRTQDVHFQSATVSQSQNGFTISGQFQKVTTASGTVTDVYIGRSVYNDLIIVSKLSNGTSVPSYIVTLSMCSLSLPDGTPLIGDSRQPTSFMAPAGIYVAGYTSCSYGQVLAAKDTLTVYPPIPQVPQQFDAVTSFFPVQCGAIQ